MHSNGTPRFPGGMVRFFFACVLHVQRVVSCGCAVCGCAQTNKRHVSPSASRVLQSCAANAEHAARNKAAGLNLALTPPPAGTKPGVFSSDRVTVGAAGLNLEVKDFGVDWVDSNLSQTCSRECDVTYRYRCPRHALYTLANVHAAHSATHACAAALLGRQAQAAPAHVAARPASL